MTVGSFRAEVYLFLKRLQPIDRQMTGRGKRNSAGKDRRFIGGLKFSARGNSIKKQKRNKTNRARDQILSTGETVRVDSRD
jgi:hypothetical protein